MVKKQTTGKEKNMVKITDLYDVKQGIANVGKFAKPPKFRYGIAKNGRKVKAEIEDIESPLELPEKIKEYQKERSELEQKLAEMNGDKVKRKDPTPTQNANRQEGDIIWKDAEQAEKEFKKLKTKYKKDLDDYDEAVRKLNDFIKKESVEFEFHMISMEEIPEDLPEKDMELLWPLLIDDFDPDGK